MTTEVHGSNYYTDIMLNHLSIGVALYDTTTLCLLEANTFYLQELDAFVPDDWRGGKALGHSIHEWGEIVSTFGIITSFQDIIAIGQTHHTQEFFLPNRQQEATYWDNTTKIVRDEQGNITHLVHCIRNVSEKVLARQKIESDKQALYQAVEAERKRLEIIEAIARSVRGTLDTKRVGDIALKAIKEQLNNMGASIHIADHTHQLLRLLCVDIDECGQGGTQGMPLSSFEKIPFERLTFMTRKVVEKDDAIFIEDIQEVMQHGKIESSHPLAQEQARGYICFPLRFNDYLEGVLGVTFNTPIKPDGVEALTLQGCGTHIAAALAHARLHAIVNHERARLCATLDQLPEGILIAEISTGAFSYANQAAAEILGIPLPQLLEIPLYKHRWHRSAYANTTADGQPLLPWNFIVVRALCGEQLRCKETLVVQPEGNYVITLASSAPLYGENGIMTSSIIVLQDITTQKSLEQHKNDFISVANHELRTPITVIQGFAEILRLKNIQDNTLDELTLQALINIIEQSEHLTHIIETMLDISHIEQDHFVLRPVSCDLLEIVTHTIESYAITTQKHQLNLALSGLSRADILNTYVDRERIGQVLHNLLSNAIKYSPAGGTIEIGLHYHTEHGPEALLWVKDEGIGISADALPHIFKRFYRDRSLDPSLSGFGIGLYLVKEIIVRHGGHIWVESAKGQGSTFYITLPLTKEAIDEAVPGDN